MAYAQWPVNQPVSCVLCFVVVECVCVPCQFIHQSINAATSQEKENCPSMQKFFEAFREFNNVSAETKERRERDGLTLEEVTEWKAIRELPAVKEFCSYMAKPPPQVRDALCKQCGKHVFPMKE